MAQPPSRCRVEVAGGALSWITGVPPRECAITLNRAKAPIQEWAQCGHHGTPEMAVSGAERKPMLKSAVFFRFCPIPVLCRADWEARRVLPSALSVGRQ